MSEGGGCTAGMFILYVRVFFLCAELGTSALPTRRTSRLSLEDICGVRASLSLSLSPLLSHMLE